MLKGVSLVGSRSSRARGYDESNGESESFQVSLNQTGSGVR